jgi:bacterioferritin-associated ferredoxin
MIVCLCRGVSDRTVHALVAAGARTHDDVKKACGAGGDCGKCRTMLAELIDEGRETRHRAIMTSPYVPAGGPA